FETAYRKLFGRTPPGAAVQFVALRVSVTALMPGAGGKLRLDGQGSGDAALKGYRDVYYADLGEKRSTPVYDRYALMPGTHITGPAVFEENESTFIVGPGARISLLPEGSIMAEYV
ncbi:MAG: hydantoinase/oxoprolinase family protein, partial [Alphaproteobacteria bacterium]